jgi:hypothetical protein
MAIQTASISTAGTTVYTSLGNSAVTFMSICNYSASSVTANVYIVPSGGTAGNTNISLAGLHLAAGNAGTGGGDTYQLYSGAEKLLLGNNDHIVVDANTNGALTVITSYTPI